MPNEPGFTIGLIIDDDPMIGPDPMIHRRHIGRGSIDYAAGGSP